MKRVILKVPAGLTLDQLTQEQQDAIASVFAQYALPMPGTIEYEEITTTESTSQTLVWLIDPFDLARYIENTDYKLEDEILVWLINPIDLANYTVDTDYKYDTVINTNSTSSNYMIVDSITADNFDPATIPNLILPFIVMGLWQWDMVSDNLDNIIPLDVTFFNYTNSTNIPHNFAGWPNA